MSSMHDRSILLLGQERFSLLSEKRVLLLGLGGVGGTCAIALARSGIRHLTLVDGDAVDASNLNRQLLFEQEDVGKRKTAVAKEKLRKANSDLDVTLFDEWVDADFFTKLDVASFDYVIDAIDDIPAKLCLAKECLAKNVPFLMSLGMANRLDPTSLKIVRLDKTFNDPLAKKIREACRKQGIDMRKIRVAFSESLPLVHGKIPSSMVMVPSAAGLALAGRAIEDMLLSIDATLSVGKGE